MSLGERMREIGQFLKESYTERTASGGLRLRRAALRDGSIRASYSCMIFIFFTNMEKGAMAGWPKEWDWPWVKERRNEEEE